MTKKAKIAVIGCGGMANSMHLPSLVEIENCEVVAVCDIIADKAKAAAEKLIAMDPDLSRPEHSAMKDRVRQMYEEEPEIFN